MNSIWKIEVNAWEISLRAEMCAIENSFRMFLVHKKLIKNYTLLMVNMGKHFQQFDESTKVSINGVSERHRNKLLNWTSKTFVKCVYITKLDTYNEYSCHFDLISTLVEGILITGSVSKDVRHFFERNQLRFRTN